MKIEIKSEGVLKLIMFLGVVIILLLVVLGLIFVAISSSNYSEKYKTKPVIYQPIYNEIERDMIININTTDTDCIRVSTSNNTVERCK